MADPGDPQQPETSRMDPNEELASNNQLDGMDETNTSGNQLQEDGEDVAPVSDSSVEPSASSVDAVVVEDNSFFDRSKESVEAPPAEDPNAVELNLFPKEVTGKLSSSAHLDIYVEQKLLARFRKDFDNIQLTEEQLKNYSSMVARDIVLDMGVRMELKEGISPSEESAQMRLKNLGFRFSRFLDSLRRRDEIEAQYVILQNEKAEQMEAISNRLTQSDAKDLDSVKLVEDLINNGVEGNLALLRKAMFSDEELFGFTVVFKNLNFTAFQHPQRALRTGPPTISSTCTNITFCCCAPMIKRCRNCILKQEEDNAPLKILSDFTGVLEPGRLALLLGPPGSGKSSLFKALTGRLHSKRGVTELEGEILYNGKNLKTLHPPNFCTMVSQLDDHLATLTTKETLQFAFDCRNKGIKRHSTVKNIDLDVAANFVQKRVDLILAVLGLTNAADTVIGNETLKGVSGGEKRRVTLGEMLVVGSKCLYLDEISTGLDSSATFDITKSIKEVNSVFMQTTVISLLQPPPETYDLFDDVILIDGGMVMYHGPREGALPHFESLGFACPKDMEEADFLQVVTSSSSSNYLADEEDLKERGVEPPRTTLEFHEAFKKTDTYKRMEEKASRPPESFVTGKQMETICFESHEYQKSRFQLMVIVLKRQWRILMRNRAFVTVRLVQNVVMGLIIGALMWQIPFAEWYVKTMVFFQFSMFVGFASMALLPDVVKSRQVFYKQSRENFYPALSYVLADFLTFLPFTLLDSLCFGTIVYFMVGLTLSDSGAHYFVFVLLAMSFGVCMASMIRLMGYSQKDGNSAYGMSVLVIVIMLFFSGAVATFDTIPNYWVWLYWISPIAWIYRSFNQNEFLSSEYQGGYPVNNNQSQCLQYCPEADGVTPNICPEPYPDQLCGDFFLTARQFQTDPYLLWLGLAMLWVYTLFFMFLSVLALKFIRHDEAEASPLVMDQNDEADNKFFKGFLKQLGKKQHTMAPKKSTAVDCALDFVPATISFQDLTYSVEIPLKGEDGKVIHNRTISIDLLKGIDGFAKPKQIVALMGSSGAGKTTLMDVLSSRKTVGKTTGTILVNGEEVPPDVFKRLIGYVEQFGAHSSSATVRESLEFSASLRLPTSVREEVREQIVSDTLALLELTEIENNLVGQLNSGGLSFEEIKRLTIGVEVVANPSIIFADEPTSGLDAHAAWVVMDALKRIAKTGRTVICTIHQPSRAIFELFDRLLLMKRGGEVVYFGDLGEDSINLIRYFEAYPGVEPCPSHYNPATWMLEVIGAGVGHANQNEFATDYLNSKLYLQNLGDMQTAIEEAKSIRVCDKVDKEEAYATSAWHQLICLMRRTSREYWRTPTFSLMRWLIIGLFALILGSIFVNRPLNNAADCQSRITSINILVLLGGTYNVQTVIPFMFGHKSFFYRERASNMYSGFIYSIAEQLVEFPYVFMESIVLVCIFYWMAGFYPAPAEFFYYWFLSFLFMAAMSYLGMMLTATLPNPSVATIAGTLFTQVLGLFAGTMVPANQIPMWLIWLHYITPMRWTQEGLISTQFEQLTVPVCIPNGVPEVVPDGSNCTDTSWTQNETINACCSVGNVPMYARDYVLGPLFLGPDTPNGPGFRYSWRYYDLIFMSCFMILCMVGALLGTQYVNYNRR